MRCSSSGTPALKFLQTSPRFFISPSAVLFQVAVGAQDLAIEQAAVGTVAAVMQFESQFAAAHLAPKLGAQ